jgi:hypothetical protein
VRSVRARLPNGMVMPNTDRDPTDLPVEQLLTEVAKLRDQLNLLRNYGGSSIDRLSIHGTPIVAILSEGIKTIDLVAARLRAMGAAVGGEQYVNGIWGPCGFCGGTYKTGHRSDCPLVGAGEGRYSEADSTESPASNPIPASVPPNYDNTEGVTARLLASYPVPQHPPHGADDDYDYGAVLRELESDTALQPPHGDDSRVERWAVVGANGDDYDGGNEGSAHDTADEWNRRGLSAAPFRVCRLVELRPDEEIVDASTINQMLRARELSSVPHPAGARSVLETVETETGLSDDEWAQFALWAHRNPHTAREAGTLRLFAEVRRLQSQHPDSVRLDWLEQSMFDCFSPAGFDAPSKWILQHPETAGGSSADTLRAAIDGAMTAALPTPDAARPQEGK